MCIALPAGPRKPARRSWLPERMRVLLGGPVVLIILCAALAAARLQRRG